MQKTDDTTASNPQRIRKTIGKVSLHFSKASIESAYDRLKRIIITSALIPDWLEHKAMFRGKADFRPALWRPRKSSCVKVHGDKIYAFSVSPFIDSDSCWKARHR